METKNRILSSVAALFVPVIVGAIIAVSFVPTAAMADSMGGWGSSAPVTVTNTSVKSVSNPVYSSKPSTPYYASKGYSTPSCYSCGGGTTLAPLSIRLDFSDNDIDQSVHNTTTNNVNVNGDNNNVGINNSNETNQNAGISQGYSYGGRDSYYDYFRNFRRSSSNNNGNSTNSGSSSQYNDTNQTNIFGSSSHSHGDDDDDNDDLSCEIDASDTSVDEGDRVTLEWETDGAVDASINQGIGSVDEDGGTERVTVDEDTTFRLTVEDEDGDEETCSVTVRVDEDDDNNFSGIVIDDEPTYNPYSGVYLSDIPYTGLDLGEYAWAYWATFAGLVAAGSYVVFFMGIPFVLRRATAIGEEVETELAEEEHKGVSQSVMSIPAAAATATGTATIVAQSDITDFVTALVDADNDTASDILENATKNGASASVFLNRASAVLRSGSVNCDASVIDMLVASLETAAKARA